MKKILTGSVLFLLTCGTAAAQYYDYVPLHRSPHCRPWMRLEDCYRYRDQQNFYIDPYRSRRGYRRAPEQPWINRIPPRWRFERY